MNAAAPLAWVSWEKLLPASARAASDHSGPNGLTALLRSLVLGLRAVEAQAHPLFNPAALGTEGFACALCVACQYDGETGRMLEHTEDVPAHLAQPANASDATLGLLFELAFYRGFAQARRGDAPAAALTWGLLEAFPQSALSGRRLAGGALRAALAKARVEQGVQLLNRGHYTRALARFDEALEDDLLDDVIVQLRGLGASGMAALGVGRLPRLRAVLAREQRLLETADCAVFRSTRIRREIGVLLTLEDYPAAERLIEEGLARVAGIDGLLEALLRQYKVQLLLLRNDLPNARAELAALGAFVSARGFSRGTVNLSDQKYELALRSREAESLKESLREGLADATARGDVRAQMSHHTFRARLALLSGEGENARQEIACAIAVCEDEDYGPDFVDCLFHAMGVAHALGDRKLFRDYVLAAGKRARKLELRVKAACFEYILSLTSPARERSGLPLLELLRAPERAEVAWYLLDFYGFLKETEFEITRETEGGAGGLAQVVRVSERDLRAHLFSGSGVWWFEEPSVLVRMPGAVVAELPAASLLRALFEALLARPAGLVSAEVHALTSAAPYHALRHASKVKTLLHRLRGVLEPIGLTISNPREQGAYALSVRPQTVRRANAGAVP